MPPKKQQKTNAGKRATRAKAQEPEPQDDHESASLPHKNDKNKGNKGTDDALKERDVETIPDDEYVCIPRPYFDFKMESRTQQGDADEEEDEEDDDGEKKVYKKYRDANNADIESFIFTQPAKDFPERKWVMLWSGWMFFRNYVRRAKYCNPDRFDMHMYNDFEGYGFQELLENMVNEFEAALKKKDNLAQVWAIISGIGLWLNEVDLGPLLGNENGEKTNDLTRLLGYTLLRGLAALDHADQLHPSSNFLDVPLVITMWLCWSADLPAYGIDNEAVDWRRHAAAYFRKAKYDPSKGISGAKQLLAKIKNVKQNSLPSKTSKDPWNWKQELKDFTSSHGIGGKIGGTQYDITLMSRKERASAAYDGEDPLKDISLKDLKEGNLDFV